jgi:hypothetical protein
VNGTRWIVLSVVWVIAGCASVLLALTSVFMFDAPGATSSKLTVALFFTVITLPVFWFLGAGLPWLFRSKRIAKWLFLLPICDLVAIGITIGAITQFCGGSFVCR